MTVYQLTFRVKKPQASEFRKKLSIQQRRFVQTDTVKNNRKPISVGPYQNEYRYKQCLTHRAVAGRFVNATRRRPFTWTVKYLKDRLSSRLKQWKKKSSQRKS